MTRPRALVVDDERPLVDVITAYLRREGFDVLAAYDGERAVELARAQAPDVILLDLMLPGIDGIEACRRIRAFSDAYIVMLTAKAEEADKIVGLSTGADDYVTKPFSPGELVARVRAMLRRPRAASGATAHRFGELEIDPQAREVRLAGRPVELTRREFDVLDALAAEPGVAFSRERVGRARGSRRARRGARRRRVRGRVGRSTRRSAKRSRSRSRSPSRPPRSPPPEHELRTPLATIDAHRRRPCDDPRRRARPRAGTRAARDPARERAPAHAVGGTRHPRRPPIPERRGDRRRGHRRRHRGGRARAHLRALLPRRPVAQPHTRRQRHRPHDRPRDRRCARRPPLGRKRRPGPRQPLRVVAARRLTWPAPTRPRSPGQTIPLGGKIGV